MTSRIAWACAGRSPYHTEPAAKKAPVVKDLSAFLDAKHGLFLIDGKCTSVDVFANGKTTRREQDAQVCRDAEVALEVATVVQAKQKAAAAAAAKAQPSAPPAEDK